VNNVYFDNAATSFPKPDGVADAVLRYINEIGANPGRAGHALSVEAGRIVFAARRAVAALVGAPDPMYVVLTPNATFALNTAISGILSEGGHAVTTSMEHNSVLRPLSALRGSVETTIVQADRYGRVDPDDIRRALRPDTRLVAVNHASNVNGVLQDVAAIGKLLRDHPAMFLVDCAQTAGSVPLNLDGLGADLLALAGHKGPMGPTGTGALVLAAGFDKDLMPPLTFGGTGSHSESIEQPGFLPDRYESGTLNVAGLAGLAEGIAWVLHEGVENIARREEELRGRFIAGALELGIVVHALPRAPSTGTVAFTIPGLGVAAAADELSSRYGVYCRQGLHCAPRAHQTLGTAPAGTLRFGFGPFNTTAEVDYALAALREMRHA